MQGRPAAVETRFAEGAPLALVASGGSSEAIAETLADNGLDLAPFDSVASLLDQAAPGRFSAILLRAEGTGSSAKSIGALARCCAEAPLVVVFGNVQRWEVRSALSCGASGIVLEQELERTLVACVRAVQAGQVCVPREHWQQVEPPALSAREKQILSLVVMGYMNGQIAERLFLAESTVKSHLSSAFTKLGVRSRHEAVNLILDPEGGLGMGILGLGGEPVERLPGKATAST